MKSLLSMLLSRKLRTSIHSMEESQCTTDSVRFTGVGTVMLSDITGITGAFETGDADEIASAMNDFCTPLIKATHATNGTILRFIGDAGLAYWQPSHKSPLHAKEAFTCGSEILRAVLNLQMTRAGSFRIRMALGTGDMTVGMIGGTIQAVGRAVATADRLLKLDLPRRSSLLCTEETLELIPNSVIPAQPLMQMQRTYGTPVNVYEFTEI